MAFGDPFNSMDSYAVSMDFAGFLNYRAYSIVNIISACKYCTRALALLNY